MFHVSVCVCVHMYIMYVELPLKAAMGMARHSLSACMVKKKQLEQSIQNKQLEQSFFEIKASHQLSYQPHQQELAETHTHLNLRVYEYSATSSQCDEYKCQCGQCEASVSKKLCLFQFAFPLMASAATSMATGSNSCLFQSYNIHTRYVIPTKLYILHSSRIHTDTHNYSQKIIFCIQTHHTVHSQYQLTVKVKLNSFTHTQTHTVSHTLFCSGTEELYLSINNM